MSRSSDSRQRTAGGSSIIGEFEKTMNGPVRTWYLVGTSVWPRSKAAQPDQPTSSRSRMAAGNRPGRRIGRSCVVRLTLPSCQDSGRPRRRFRDRLVRIARSIDRQKAFQSFRGDKPQGR